LATERITVPRPDDAHLHLRDGAAMAAVVHASASWCARAVVMPNLRPPVATVAEALAYRARILAVGAPASFQPMMALYLTSGITTDEVRRVADTPEIAGVKLYPAGATTNSEAGVEGLDVVMPALEAMAARGVPLLVHGESTDPEVDPFDREAVFIERTLLPLSRRLPELRVVLEHVTTAEGVAFVAASPAHVAATITPQHLLWNRSALFAGGIRPHAWCLPVLKRERHRRALVAAAVSGDPKFFLGTDSAPHGRRAKEASCGCAGIFNAPVALAVYAEVFAEAGALDHLEGFASRHAAAFYGWPVTVERLALVRTPVPVPEELPFGDDVVVPMLAGATVAWRIETEA
jgi:dihydroorotase